MRVIAGEARSLPLKTPAGMDTRPTTDRIKETLFNMLQPYIPGCVFVDLCSGSGGIGIEAISRGARRAYLVDNSQAAAACILDNLKFTHFTDRGILLRRDVLSAIGSIHEKQVDVIFMDPPYQAMLEEPVLRALAQARYVTGETLIVIEAGLEKDFSFCESLGYMVTKEKKYRTNKHVFIMKKTADEAADLHQGD